MNQADKKIAELLGWRFRTNYETPSGKAIWELGYWEMDGKQAHYGPFRPSIDLNQAIQLLEGLEDWRLTKAEDFTCQIITGWDPDGEGTGPWANGKTPSEAICNAWISYKEGQVNG